MVFIYVTHSVGLKMIFIDFYNDIHSKFINICQPTDPLVEDRVKQRYWLEWPNQATGCPTKINFVAVFAIFIL